MSAVLPAFLAPARTARDLAPEAAARLLAAARAAPSAENHHFAQPRWDGEGTVSLDLDAEWDGLPRQTRFLAGMGLGAMAENLQLAAAGELTALHEQWNWRAAGGGTIAFFAVAGQLGSAPSAIGTIARRCTNRQLFDPAPLDPTLVRRLDRAAAGVPGTVLHWITARPTMRAVAALAGTAEGARFVHRHLHQEIFAHVRFDAGWERSCDHGLPPGALAIERPLRPAFALLRHWPLCAVGRWLGLGLGLGLRAGRLPALRSGALVAISADATGITDAVHTGRAMQRLWLTATEAGLAVQPIPASCLFTLDWWQGVPPALRERLARGWEALIPGRQPLMLLRLGRAPEPGVRAGRPAA
jgi:hypothetical protein